MAFDATSAATSAPALMPQFDIAEALSKTIDLEKAGLMLAYIYLHEDDEALLALL